MQSDPADFPIREIQKFRLQSGLIKKRPIFATRRKWNSNPGMAGQSIKLLQSALGEQIMDEQAPLATEGPFRFGKRAVEARFATMKAGHPLVWGTRNRWSAV